MTTPLTALIWEYIAAVRTRWWQFVPLLLVFPVVLCVTRMQGYPTSPMMTEWPMPPRPIDSGAELACLLFNFIVVMFWLGIAAGMPARHYTLPISTPTLIAGRVLPGMVIAAGSHLLVATLLNWTINPSFPYLGPALWYALGYVAIQAAVWPFRGRENMQVMSGSVACAVVMVWLLGHYTNQNLPAPLGNWQPLFSNPSLHYARLLQMSGRRQLDSADLQQDAGSVTATELSLGMMLIAGAGAWLCYGLPMERSGGWRWSSRRARSKPVAAARAEPGVAFLKPWRSPQWSIFWSEWRQDGWLIPLALAGVLLLGGVIHSVAVVVSPFYRTQQFQGVNEGVYFAPLAMASVVVWLSLFSCVTTQHGNRTNKQLGLPTYYSTLPLSNVTLGTVFWLRGVATLIVGFVLVMLSGLIVIGLHEGLRSAYGFQDLYRRPWTIRPQPGSWMSREMLSTVGFLFWGTWTILGLGLSTTLTGRRSVAYLPLILLLVMPLIQAFGIIDAIAGPTPAAQMTLMLLPLALLCLAGALASAGTLRVRWYHLALLLFVGASFIGYLVLVHRQMYEQQRPNPLAYVPFWGLCVAVVMSPVLTIPGAVAWNRHR